MLSTNAVARAHAPLLARRRARALALAVASAAWGGAIPALAADGVAGEAPPSAPAQAPGRDAPPRPQADPYGESSLARRLAIADLEDVVLPSGLVPTTAALGERHQPGRRELPGDLVVETRCGESWCVDGLSVRGRTLLAAEPTAEERRWVRRGWLERVVRVDWWDESFVSVYVAESSFVEGAAHANNALRCRTFDARSGRALSLRDVLPARSAALVLAKARRLFEDEVAIEELGHALDFGPGYELRSDGFRLARTDRHGGERPEIILCAQGVACGSDGAMVELRLEAMPVAYLLR